MPDFYGTTEEADAYHAARGNAAWSAARDEDKTVALTNGSAYVDSLGRKQLASGAWIALFPGTKTGQRTQSLEWPRTNAADYSGNALDDDEVPIEVRQATYEAALRELSCPGSLRPDFLPSAMVKSEKAGPWEEEYFAPVAGTNPALPVIAVILDLLAPVLISPSRGLGIMVV